MKLQVVLQPEEEGGYSAFVPGFPSISSCGDTLEETLANIREAFEGVFEVMQAQDTEAGIDPEFPAAVIIRETIDL